MTVTTINMVFEFEGFGFKFGPYAAAETQAVAGVSIWKAIRKDEK